jgi:hypothetical protein
VGERRKKQWETLWRAEQTITAVAVMTKTEASERLSDHEKNKISTRQKDPERGKIHRVA